MKKWSTETLQRYDQDYKTKIKQWRKEMFNEEEQEPIDVVQVMYNALTNLEKQYVWVVMVKTPREDKIVVAFQEKEPTMKELAERDDVRDMFEYGYRHGHRDAQFSQFELTNFIVNSSDMFVLAQESLKQVNDTRTMI